MSTPEPPKIPPIPPTGGMQFEPMPENHSVTNVIETLLKNPGRIVYELHHQRSPKLGIALLTFAILGVVLYGVVVGSLSGGMQLLVAPAKIALGMLAAVLICLPSLYIFVSLSGVDAPVGAVSGALSGAVCLGALLLIGFAPVAWIFSQSTDSAGFIGTLHLLFWLIGIGFGFRILRAMCRFGGARGRGHLRIWSLIFLIVTLQMTTTLRPIIGTSDRFFPAEKKFFLSYWLEFLTGKATSQAK